MAFKFMYEDIKIEKSEEIKDKIKKKMVAKRIKMN